MTLLPESPPTAPRRDDPAVGTLLGGRYRLTDVLGTGGAATVYRAEDRLLRRTVAIKLFLAGSADPAELSAHQDEARMLAPLSHDSLVTLLDAGVDAAGRAPRVYLVLEFVDGSDLRERLRSGPLSLRHAAHLGFDLAEALDFIHGRGIVHRDVKPGNVLLVAHDEARRPRAKLADFGIATLVGGEPPDGEYTTGTAAYLSPEQASGGVAGPSSDVYSLGLVLLQAVTGEVAFPGSVLESALARLQRDPAVPDTLPAPWRSVLTAMTARDGGDRPTPSDLAVVFRQLIIDSEPTPACPTGLDEEARLAALARYDLLDAPPEGAFDRITSLAARTIGVPISTVSIVDRERIWFMSHHGLDAEQIGRDPGLCATVVETGRARVIPDARLDPIAKHNPLIAGDPGFRFYAGVPLTTSDGHVLGSLSVIDVEPRTLSPNELEILISLGEMVTHEMEIRRATRRARLRSE